MRLQTLPMTNMQPLHFKTKLVFCKTLLEDFFFFFSFTMHLQNMWAYKNRYIHVVFIYTPSVSTACMTHCISFPLPTWCLILELLPATWAGILSFWSRRRPPYYNLILIGTAFSGSHAECHLARMLKRKNWAVIYLFNQYPSLNSMGTLRICNRQDWSCLHLNICS